MKTKRFLAWVVTALMLLTSFALPAPLGGAREAEASSLNIPQDPVAVVNGKSELTKDVTSGQCGPKLTWSFDLSTGELIISGSGEMYDYDRDRKNPWAANSLHDKILAISLPKGLTAVGAYAFDGCSALTSVALPGKVKTIGEGAFDQCTSIKSITIPNSVTRIEASAFAGCTALKHVYYQGAAAQKVQISIKQNNGALLNATWHYSKDTTASLAIKAQPKDVTVEEGQVATFKVKVAGATAIQWQYRKPGDTTWHDVGLSADTCSLVVSTLNNDYLYRCVVSNGTSTLYSAPAKLTVKATRLAIKSNPKNVKTYEGKKVTFRIKAKGAAYYQWQYRWIGDSYWTNWEGATSKKASFVAQAGHDGLVVRCMVSNANGETIYSNEATLFIKIKIKTKPKSVTVPSGDTAYFSVVGTGATHYQWEYRWPDDTTWYDLDVDASGFGIEALPKWSGLSFRCKLYNNTSYKYTSVVTLTVVPHYRALLIGESNYSDKPLPGGVYNASAMAGMLRGLKNNFTTTTLTNCSSSQILNGISTAFADATEADVSLFYYSGHGGYSSNYSVLGALCPVSGSYISFSQLAAALSNVKGRVIVILDSCHSGAAIGKDYGSKAAEDALDAYNKAAIDAFSGYKLASNDAEAEKWGELATNKFIVLTAASYYEECWNSLNYGIDGSSYPQGFFTAALIKGMGCKYPNGRFSRSMPADRNHNKKITLQEIYNYSNKLALKWNKKRHLSLQHAQYYGNANEVLFRRK